MAEGDVRRTHHEPDEAMSTDGSERPLPSVSFEFGHDIEAASAARQALSPLLREGDEFAADVELVTSELVTNVIQHTDDGGRVDAWDDDPLLLEVEDHDPTAPAVPPVPTERGGRGLTIVGKVADEWGVQPTSTGKRVWAKFGRRTGGSESAGTEPIAPVDEQ
jgi:anti-sigma regulatory factor (Ser/Thr protein kinase)